MKQWNCENEKWLGFLYHECQNAWRLKSAAVFSQKRQNIENKDKICKRISHLPCSSCNSRDLVRVSLPSQDVLGASQVSWTPGLPLVSFWCLLGPLLLYHHQAPRIRYYWSFQLLQQQPEVELFVNLTNFMNKVFPVWTPNSFVFAFAIILH